MRTDDLIESLSANLKPVRPAFGPISISLLWAAVALAGVVAFVPAYIGTRPDLAEVTKTAGFFLTLATLFGVLASAAYLGCLLSLPGRSVKTSHHVVPSVCLLLFNVVLLFHFIPTGQCIADGMPLAGFRCTMTLLTLGIVPGILLFFLLRRLAPLDTRATAEAIALAMGAVGAFGLSLHCPSANWVHLIVYHSAPLYILGFAAKIAGPKILRW